MKQKARAPQKKLRVKWTDESFGLPVQPRPDSNIIPLPLGLTDFLHRHTVPIGDSSQAADSQEAACCRPGTLTGRIAVGRVPLPGVPPLHNLHRTLRNRAQKRVPVTLRQNPVIQHHNDSGVAFGPN